MDAAVSGCLVFIFLRENGKTDAWNGSRMEVENEVVR